tara:strand:+ start:837 stop:1817 length:981 start_codon:yes stop_codon:yes gene_type:complete
MKKTALITGARGQDAFYLGKLLLSKNYVVVLLTRNNSDTYFKKVFFEYGNIATENRNIFVREIDCTNLDLLRSVFNEFEIDEIYNLGGQSSVLDSFIHPTLSNEQPLTIFNNFLKIIKEVNNEIKMFQASSSEIFEDAGKVKINEHSKLKALSPYAEGKLKVHEKILEEKNKGKLFLVSGIMFNHESVKRSKKYLFGYLSDTVLKIKDKEIDNFEISNLNTVRDWGYSEEYVEAMWKTLNFESPDTYIISTGISYTVKEIIEHALGLFNLKIENHVIETLDRKRYYDVLEKYSDPSKINKKLSWKANYDGKKVIELIINEKIKKGK